MGQKYLIDTNVAIDYLNNRLPETTRQIVNTHTINLSVISRMELLVWAKATNDQQSVIRNFINAGSIFPLDEPVILKGIEIRKKHKIPLPDAIIAATAVVHRFTLITRNLSDFKNIEKLKVFN